jgi:hypothetical protein
MFLLLSVQTGSGAHPDSCLMGMGALSRGGGGSCKGVKLTTPHLVTIDSYVISDSQSVSQYVLVPNPLWACDQTLFPVLRLVTELLSCLG